MYLQKLENTYSLISVFCFRNLKITISLPLAVIYFFSIKEKDLSFYLFVRLQGNEMVFSTREI